MNPLKKIYCRIFQTAFKLALPLLPYRNPKILGSVKEIPALLEKKNCNTVLLITDGGIRKLGLTERLEKALADAGIPCIVYDRTVANPTAANVEEALNLYLSNNCQAIIGFGGGSSMDCAKAVGAGGLPEKSLAKMEGILKVRHKLPLLIAVPTTAGTGSETTLAAVITDDKTRHKYPINDFFLIPDYAVLDPKVTLSLPPFITATTGMDALTTPWRPISATPPPTAPRENALQAVKLIFENFRHRRRKGFDTTAAETCSGPPTMRLCLHQILCGLRPRRRSFSRRSL